MFEKYSQINKNLQEVSEWLKTEMKQISAGVANISVLDAIYIDAYGSRTQVGHVAAVNIEDPKTIKIAPWDKSQTKAIETAIRDADLGLSIVVDSECVRVIFPQLTTETRAKYVKLAKSKHEEARIRVRGVRQEVMDELDKSKKEGGVSEDDISKKKEDTQKKVDQTNIELDAIFEVKEEAIMKV